MLGIRFYDNMVISYFFLFNTVCLLLNVIDLMNHKATVYK